MRVRVTSGGKLRTHVRRDANWTSGLRIDGTPERARLREELAIALTPDLGEPFKREPSGFADPCAKHDFVAERGGRLVVDFVSQHNPADRLLSFGVGYCSPMRGGDILHPAQVNSVVYVILLVDIPWQNRNGHFESGGGHRKLATRSSKVQNAARTEAGIFFAGVGSRFGRSLQPYEKLHQGSLFGSRGGHLRDCLCGGSASVQKERQELPNE